MRTQKTINLTNLKDLSNFSKREILKLHPTTGVKQRLLLQI
ncbi:hypothetical protein CAMRE0001_1628 [Campylobacter rectus RM3267]|uniref:Uncharacterized protein n=1 Tax=Campylobacter rectus RM3267 TaxID=553218 RepID=B9CZ49_CAMRE|nr:hypothetical protein CAMRE0001_1628 [Campylobacter rectus RM3267]